MVLLKSINRNEEKLNSPQWIDMIVTRIEFSGNVTFMGTRTAVPIKCHATIDDRGSGS